MFYFLMAVRARREGEGERGDSISAYSNVWLEQGHIIGMR